METLIEELESYKKNLSSVERMQLSDSVLDKLYTVYIHLINLSTLSLILLLRI